MGEWHRENPEAAEAISRLPRHLQLAEERSVIPDPLERADRERDERREAITETFTPWTEDRMRLARLWRWLRLTKEAPENPADFLEAPEVYAQQYADMCLFEGKAS